MKRAARSRPVTAKRAAELNAIRGKVEQEFPPATVTQVDRVIAAFGGPTCLRDALARAGRPRHLSAIYRWNHAEEDGGSGGLIPRTALEDVLEAAKVAGVTLDDATLSPRKSAKTTEET